MSQAQLAEILDRDHGIRLDPTAITRMEKGRRRIALDEAVAIAATLNVRLFDLLSPAMALAAAAHPDKLRQDAERLAAELARIDGQLAQAEADTAKARARYAELRRRRNEVQVELAAIVMQPGGPGSEAGQ